MIYCRYFETNWQDPGLINAASRTGGARKTGNILFSRPLTHQQHKSKNLQSRNFHLMLKWMFLSPFSPENKHRNFSIDLAETFVSDKQRIELLPPYNWNISLDWYYGCLKIDFDFFLACHIIFICMDGSAVLGRLGIAVEKRKWTFWDQRQYGNFEGLGGENRGWPGPGPWTAALQWISADGVSW